MGAAFIPYIGTTLMGYGVSVGTAFAIGTFTVAVAQTAILNFGLGALEYTDEDGNTWEAL